MSVKPKKYLGQHFLKDRRIARSIADALSTSGSYAYLAEVGPGTGVLTDFLADLPFKGLYLFEIDRDAVEHLKKHYTQPHITIIEGDFLQQDLHAILPKPFGVIGNFPYNISSQIFFRILQYRDKVREVVCMLQREVAQRICASPGSKTYGILSVLLGAYYDLEYLFEVPPGVFHPPPKVFSAVIRLSRNTRTTLPCDAGLFEKIVKQGFQNRRKTLRNALKAINLPADLQADPLLSLRAEQLAVADFISLTQKAEAGGKNNAI
jgi:16S rRNA (adenine1518-N6/adenine1519-N6)-dimethyltransferase